MFYYVLPYTTNAILDLFQRVSHFPWSMLLSSGYSNRPDGRFDIMVSHPIVTLETYGKITYIRKDQIVIKSEKDPLLLLISELKKLLPNISMRSDLPFQGGALGLFGYDLSRRFEQFPEKAKSDLITPDMAIGLYDWALISDHQKKTLTLVDYKQNSSKLNWLKNLPNLGSKSFKLTSVWKSNLTPESYQMSFNKIQEWLQSGDCYQVNFSQRFQASYEGDEWKAFLRLNRSNRSPFSAFLRLPNSTILSMSPERFLSLRGKIIETCPIKGTLPRLKNEKEDHLQAIKLANSEKDRAENLMIVDLLRNDIGRVAVPGSIHVPSLFLVEKFSSVYHLVSTIRAKLKQNLNAIDLIRACFPGGSITGAPKIRAMEIIEELEPQRRNAWCGSIGYLSCCGCMDSNIAIRTLIAERGILYCSAGSGIVADSKRNIEYQETIDKLQNILHILRR